MKVSKDILKGMTIGIIITSLVFCTIFAAPVSKTIQVVFSDVKVALDGKILDFKDAAGNKIDPIVYNGTTYLPLRAIANAFGKEITPASAKDNTIYLGKVIKPNGMEIGIGDMTPFIKSKMLIGTTWDQDKKLKMANIEYESKDALLCNGIGANGSSTITFLLDNKYSKLSGLFGVDDSSPDPVSGKVNAVGACLQIIGDNNVLYETPVATKGGAPMKVTDVNLIGVKQMTIKILDSNKSSDYRYKYDFVHVKLTKVLEQ